MKWIGLISTLILALIVLMFSFSHWKKAQSPIDLTLVVTSWPTAQLLYAAVDLGYFEREGLNVKLIDVRDDYEEAVLKIKSKEVDGGVLVLSEPLLLTAGGQPMSVVMGLDYSNGADGIVVSEEIKTLEDLKGKKIAYERGSFGDLLLQQALRKANLSVADIQIHELSPAEASRAFLLDDVDAAVAVEPYLSQALVRTRSHVIFSSSESPGLLPDVVTFRREVVDNKPVAIKSFVNAWYKFREDLESDKKTDKLVKSIVAIRLGETLATVENEFSGIYILNRQEGYLAFTNINQPASLIVSGQRFIDFFRSGLNLEISDNLLREVLDTRFVTP